MKRHLLHALLPPILLALTFSLLWFIPSHPELQEAAISPDLPLDYDLEGWYGEKVQESEAEREALAADTRFSKAVYYKLRANIEEPRGPKIMTSIVYSGSDMNSSIHRPERCLPTQGHLDMMGTDAPIMLDNGRKITFRRLTSRTLINNRPGRNLQHINYYVFVGHDSLQHSHYSRTFKDMYDRVIKGRTQRWAYFQVGVYWGGDTGISEKLADNQAQELIRQLLPRLADWNALKN